MKKLFSILALGLLVALPGCRCCKKEKAQPKKESRAKTAKKDMKGKAAPAKRANRNMMVDAECE